MTISWYSHQGRHYCGECVAAGRAGFAVADAVTVSGGAVNPYCTRCRKHVIEDVCAALAGEHFESDTVDAAVHAYDWEDFHQVIDSSGTLTGDWVCQGILEGYCLHRGRAIQTTVAREAGWVVSAELNAAGPAPFVLVYSIARAPESGELEVTTQVGEYHFLRTVEDYIESTVDRTARVPGTLVTDGPIRRQGSGTIVCWADDERGVFINECVYVVDGH